MPKTNLKLYATDALGTATTTTINYVNPDADNADILTFTQMLNNDFTNNTYGKTEKIVTTEVDNEPIQQTPTFEVGIATISSGNFTLIGNSYYMWVGDPPSITYDGDGDFIVDVPEQTYFFTCIARDMTVTNRYKISFYIGTTARPSTSFDIKIGFTETENYKACSHTIRYTA